MTRLSLLLMLGLAAGCDAWTDQPFTQGCTRANPLDEDNVNSSVLTSEDIPLGSVIDLNPASPTYGMCVGRAVPGGSTGGGTGGTGGGECPPPAEVPPLEGESNFETCGSEADPCNLNCDYGCTALGNTFGFIAVFSAAPDASFSGGSSSETDFAGYFVVSEAFIQGATETLGQQLNAARVLPGSAIPITALEGATGPDLTLTLEEVEVDLTEDPDGNGAPGPFFLPFIAGSETYTYGSSGEQACFNLTQGVTFGFEITDPFVLPAVFMCEPTNQELINQDNVMCSDDDACLSPSTCDTIAGDCLSTIMSEPEAGEVCITIP